MNYFVYILQSEVSLKYYVGQTENFETRFERHNRGSVPSTKSGVPWTVVKVIPVLTRTEAIILETKIKKRGIARFLKENFGV